MVLAAVFIKARLSLLIGLLWSLLTVAFTFWIEPQACAGQLGWQAGVKPGLLEDRFQFSSYVNGSTLAGSADITRRFSRDLSEPGDFFVKREQENDGRIHIKRREVLPIAWNLGVDYSRLTAPVLGFQITDNIIGGHGGLNWQITPNLGSAFELAVNSIPEENYSRGAIALRFEYLIALPSLRSKIKADPAYRGMDEVGDEDDYDDSESDVDTDFDEKDRLGTSSSIASLGSPGVSKGQSVDTLSADPDESASSSKSDPKSDKLAEKVEGNSKDNAEGESGESNDDYAAEYYQKKREKRLRALDRAYRNAVAEAEGMEKSDRLRSYPNLIVAYHFSYNSHQVSPKVFLRQPTLGTVPDGVGLSQNRNGPELIYSPTEKLSIMASADFYSYTKPGDSILTVLELGNVTQGIGPVGPTNQFLTFPSYDYALSIFWNINQRNSASLGFHYTTYAFVTQSSTLCISPVYRVDLGRNWRLGVGGDVLFDTGPVPTPFTFLGSVQILYRFKS